MTPAQALAVMVLLRPRIGFPLAGVDGLEMDFGQLVLKGPAGYLSVAIPLPHPTPYTDDELTQLAVRAESRIREVLTVFETPAGRGFSDFGRGSLRPGEGGFSAGDGAV